MKTLVFILTILICACANNTNKTIATPPTNEKDSINHRDITVQTNTASTPVADTTFFVNGKTQLINGLSCYIEYKVTGDSGVRDSLQKVIIENMVLKTPKQSIPIEYWDLYEREEQSLQKLKNYLLMDFDLLTDKNKDGYLDIEVSIEFAQNNQFKVFLFSPNKKTFNYSELFSGNIIVYDKKLNRISDFGTTGAGSHTFIYFNLNKDNNSVASEEWIKQSMEGFFYEKIVNKKVVKRKSIKHSEASDDFDFEEWLERGRSTENN